MQSKRKNFRGQVIQTEEIAVRPVLSQEDLRCYSRLQKGNNMQKAPNQPACTLFKLLLSGRWLFHCILTAAGLRLSAAVNLQAATRNSVQLKCNTKKSNKNKGSRHAGKPTPGIPLLGQPSLPATELILLQQESCRRISPLLLQRSSAVPRLMYGEIAISAVAWIYSNLGHEMS